MIVFIVYNNEKSVLLGTCENNCVTLRNLFTESKLLELPYLNKEMKK